MTSKIVTQTFSDHPFQKKCYMWNSFCNTVQQRLREKEEEKLECEKRESEIRRQSELPTDLTDKLRSVIPVDPIISPLDSGEDRLQERIYLFLPGHLSTHQHQT